MNAGSGEHIDSATEAIFRVLAKANHVEQGSISIHIHEEIQIAGRTGFPAGLRSEDPYVLGSVFGGDPKMSWRRRSKSVIAFSLNTD